MPHVSDSRRAGRVADRRAVAHGHPWGLADVRESALQGLPNAVLIACTLTPDAGKEQVEKWRAFDDGYLLDVERGDARIIVHYAKADDSVQRLHDLVAVKSACCSFVDWSIDESHADLRLVVTGSAEQLAALDVG